MSGGEPGNPAKTSLPDLSRLPGKAAGNLAAEDREPLAQLRRPLHPLDQRRDIALLLAVLNDRTPAAKMLLAHGASIEDKAPDGTTVLNMAAVNAYYDMASMLLDMGADPNAADPRGSALHSLIWLRKPGTSWEAAAGGWDDAAAQVFNVRFSAV